MKKERVIAERSIDASPKKVWAVLTDRDMMKQWCFDVDRFEPEVGCEFHFMGQRAGTTYFHQCRVTEVVPLRRLTYSWQYIGYPGDSLVTFELIPDGAGTVVRLMHDGLESFPLDTEAFALDNFVKGWNHIMDALKAVMTNVK